MEFVFNAFVTLLVVVDPLGLAPIFAALTRGFPEKQKRESAIRGTLLGALILFRIAGGLLLFLLSLDMVFARPSGMRATSVREQEEESYQQDISVFPLAIPLLAGPGAITTVLLFTGGSSAGQVALFIAVLFVILLLTLGSLLLAPRVMRLFGETGTNFLSRVLGVLLAALAVQFVINGLQASIT